MRRGLRRDGRGSGRGVGAVVHAASAAATARTGSGTSTATHSSHRSARRRALPARFAQGRVYAGRCSSRRYLFAWNPALWDWPTLPDDIRTLARRGHLDTEWSAGRTRKLEPGSRAYLVRLGVPPRACSAAGTVMTAPVERLHWRKDKAAEGAKTGYVMLRLDALFEMPPVTFDELARPPFAGFRWSMRQSGTRVPGRRPRRSTPCGSRAVRQPPRQYRPSARDGGDDCRRTPSMSAKGRPEGESVPKAQREGRSVSARLAADAVVLVHLAFVVFVVVGGWLVDARPRMALGARARRRVGRVGRAHRHDLPADAARERAPAARRRGRLRGGLHRALPVPLLYPAGLTPGHQRWIGAFVVAVNVAAYALAIRRARRLRRATPRTGVASAVSTPKGNAP